jgi:hypothetical protein
MAAKSIPDGYHTATPYLLVRNAAEAIDFYKRAFGATELMRLVPSAVITQRVAWVAAHQISPTVWLWCTSIE